MPQRQLSLSTYLVGCLRLLVLYTLVSLLWQHSTVPSLTQSPLPPNRSQFRRPEPAVLLLRRTHRRPFLHKSAATNTTSTSSSSSQPTPTNGPPPPKRRYFPGHPVPPSSSVHRPPLATLVQNDTIVGDVQFLLDFAIVGFGKTGTTTLLEWLAAHPQTAVFAREVYLLVEQRPAALVRALYQDLPSDPAFLRGYKNPLEVTVPHVLEYYTTYWPRTKLILGLRHPVWWFESLYNFRVRHLPPGQHLPDPNHLIGPCLPDRQQTCTEKGNFARALLRLGKTRSGGDGGGGNSSSTLPSPLTQAILGRPGTHGWFNVSQVPVVPNPLFLYHLEEMTESPNALATALRQYLGLNTDLVLPLPHRNPGAAGPADANQQQHDSQMDICHPLYEPVRHEMLRLGAQSAQWIEEEFLPCAATVHVTDHHRFVTRLRQWGVDPCTGGDLAHGGGGTRRHPHAAAAATPPLAHDPLIVQRAGRRRPWSVSLPRVGA